MLVFREAILPGVACLVLSYGGLSPPKRMTYQITSDLTLRDVTLHVWVHPYVFFFFFFYRRLGALQVLYPCCCKTDDPFLGLTERKSVHPRIRIQSPFCRRDQSSYSRALHFSLEITENCFPFCWSSAMRTPWSRVELSNHLPALLALP